MPRKETKIPHIPHDAVVLLACKYADKLAKDVGVPFTHVQLEWEISPKEHNSHWDHAAFVDLAFFFEGTPTLLVEVKTPKELVSPANVYRQLRKYAEKAGVPCVLLHAMDLPGYVQAYLSLVDVCVIDLRKYMSAGHLRLLSSGHGEEEL